MKTQTRKVTVVLTLIFSLLIFIPKNSFAQAAVVTQLTCEEVRFVKLINIYRAQLRLSVLKVARLGVQAARWHAFNMGSLAYFDHTEPNGRTAFERMAAFNYPGQAENIAAGNSDAGRTFCQWKTSPGHDRNMRGVNWTTLSIGQSAVQGSRYINYWSSGFSSKVTDLMSEPISTLMSCALPSQLPNCIK